VLPLDVIIEEWSTMTQAFKALRIARVAKIMRLLKGYRMLRLVRLPRWAGRGSGCCAAARAACM
jgi:hypothetical protein